MKKQSSLVLYVIHDDNNHEDFVADVIKWSMGYETTQAANCAYMVTKAGEYAIRTFKSSEMEKATTLMNVILEQGVPAYIKVV